MSALLEREFEKLHGIKWADAAFSVRACWTDAWLTATAREREACAEVCEAKARTLGERADLCDDDEDAIELKARAWQMAVLAAELRERSNSNSPTPKVG